MSEVLEIVKLENGEIILRDANSDAEPLLRLRFSDEVMDMLGDDVDAVAETMIDAAAELLSGGELENRSNAKSLGQKGSHILH